MADYSLGTAEGTIKIGYDGKGIAQAGQGMDDLESKARKVQKGFQTVATTTGIASGAIATGIGFAVNAAIDFEKQISAIGAVSGATKDQLEILRKKALQLGADTAFSANDAAQAMEELVKAGLSVEDVLNGAADATVALAAAGEVSLPEAAAIASNAMNQFGLSAQELPKVADLIAGAANASAIDVRDFGFSMSQAGAVADLVGVKFDDLAVAIALMGNQGIKGSDAGTALKTMLQNLQPTTTKQIALMKELGIVTADGSNKFFDQKGHLKSLADVSGILNKALSGMTDQQKSMALETIFGSDAIRAAAILAGQGSQGFNAMAKAMAGVTAQGVAAGRLDNVAGSIEQLKGSVESAAIAFGSALLPAIRKITDFVTLLVNKFSAMDPRWQKLIAFAAVAAAALLGLVAVIAGIGAALAGLALASGALEIGAIIAGVVVAVIALATAIKLAYDRSETFRNLLAKLGEVAKAIFGAIMAVVRPLIAFFKNDLIPAVKEIAAKLMKDLQPAFKAVQDFISNRVLPAVEKLKGALDKAMPTIIKIGQAFLATSKFIFGALGKALGFIIPLLLKIIGPIFSLLITVISAVIGFIPTLVGWFMKLVDIIITIGKWIGIAVIAPFYLIYQVGKFVFEALMAVVMVFINAFLAVWGFIAPVVQAVFGLIASIIGLAFSIIGAIFQAGWIVIKAIWDLVWDYVIKPVSAAFSAIWNFLKAAFDVILGIINVAWDAIKAVWSFIWTWIVQPIIDAFKAIAEWIGKKMGEAKDIASTVWNAITKFFSDAKDKIIKIVNGFTEFVQNIKKHFGDAKEAALTKLTELVAFVKTLPGKILDAIGNLGKTLYNSGKSLIQGFWDGIKDLWNKMVGWVEDRMGSLRDLWPFSPAKRGPFSGRGWVLYSGRALMEGFADGMKDRTGAVDEAAKRALAGVAGKLPKDFSATVSASQANAGMAAGLGGGAAAVSAAGPTTNSTEININVPLEDLRSIRDVQDLLDFIDRLRNDSRRGMEVTV